MNTLIGNTNTIGKTILNQTKPKKSAIQYKMILVVSISWLYRRNIY